MMEGNLLILCLVMQISQCSIALISVPLYINTTLHSHILHTASMRYCLSCIQLMSFDYSDLIVLEIVKAIHRCETALPIDLCTMYGIANSRVEGKGLPLSSVTQCFK